MLAVTVALLLALPSAQPTGPRRDTAVLERQSEQVYEKELSYARLGGGKNLRQNPSDVYIHLDKPVQTGQRLGDSDRLRRSVCESDVVAVVKVVAQRPFLTGDGTFIMTEYTLSASEVLRGTVVEREVRYVRPGGRMTVNGTSITAALSTISLLEIGPEYLVFLTKDAGTNFFRSRFESTHRLDIFAPGTPGALATAIQAVREERCRREPVHVY
jgi:hypothetical protein